MAKKRIPKKVKREIVDYIAALKADSLPIRQVILFGSYAKGKSNDWSDIDLCIVSPKFKDSFTATQYLWLKRQKDSGLVIEPVGFNMRDFGNKYDSLVNEIKTTGIPIAV
jgi:hypothetical protein